MDLSELFHWDGAEARRLRKAFAARRDQILEALAAPHLGERRADMIRGQIELLDTMLGEISEPRVQETPTDSERLY